MPRKRSSTSVVKVKPDVFNSEETVLLNNLTNLVTDKAMIKRELEVELTNLDNLRDLACKSRTKCADLKLSMDRIDPKIKDVLDLCRVKGLVA